MLMSDGLYDAYQLYTQRPDFVNRDLGYLIAQEMKQSTDIAAVAHNVVKKVKQLYRITCKKNVCKGRLDDITLVIRNLSYPMASFPRTDSGYRSGTNSPMPLPRRDLKPIQPKDSSDEFDLYGWKADDATPMSSQPSSLAANSEGGTLTGPPHEEETIDKPDSDSERNEDGENIGVLTLPGDPLLSDFSETSDLEEEEKDVDPDGMIKSHVKFNTNFYMNMSWDELGGEETPLQGNVHHHYFSSLTNYNIPVEYHVCTYKAGMFFSVL